jgi:copper chaperone CopZ
VSTERRSLRIEGMTCNGCENAVSNALKRVEGVREARADHHTGRVEVELDHDPGDDALRAAVDRAGFTLVD